MTRRIKRFFFEKKNQKNFCFLVYAMRRGPRQPDKSFLLLFFKKEDLSSLGFPRPSATAGHTCKFPVHQPRHVLQRPHDGTATRERVGRRHDRVGHHHHHHRRVRRGAHAVVRIFQRQAGGRCHVHAAGGCQEAVGRGFAGGHVVTADDRGKPAGQSRPRQLGGGGGCAGGGGDGAGDARLGKLVEQPLTAPALIATPPAERSDLCR